jgi:vacuolar-type H+-ATPase subunit E/Vma4
VTMYVKFTPVGEYLRLVILRRLSEGPAAVEEIEALAKRIVEALGVRYDWKVWPRLFQGGEVEVRGGVVSITQRGKWILELTGEEVARYVKKRLGVEA